DFPRNNSPQLELGIFSLPACHSRPIFLIRLNFPNRVLLRACSAKCQSDCAASGGTHHPEAGDGTSRSRPTQLGQIPPPASTAPFDEARDHHELASRDTLGDGGQ